uniref:Replication-associated protein n=1 Tax=Cressdnaviricota sp. TaxID=2748378 RepID=A0A6M9ZA82_9VIRU|nr:MAG: replication-associated protein [Cressdnaviricota sp.]
MSDHWSAKWTWKAEDGKFYATRAEALWVNTQIYQSGPMSSTDTEKEPVQHMKRPIDDLFSSDEDEEEERPPSKYFKGESDNQIAYFTPVTTSVGKTFKKVKAIDGKFTLDPDAPLQQHSVTAGNIRIGLPTPPQSAEDAEATRIKNAKCKVWMGTFWYKKEECEAGNLTWPFGALPDPEGKVQHLIGQIEITTGKGEQQAALVKAFQAYNKDPSKSIKFAADGEQRHLQFTVTFKHPTTRSGALWILAQDNQARAAVLYQRCYLEPSRNAEWCRAYCKDAKKRMEGTNVVEIGAEPVRGVAPEAMDAVQDIEAGMTIQEIIRKYPKVWTRHHQMLKATANLMGGKPRDLDDKPEVVVYYGIPGSGKSWSAQMENPGAYRKDSTKWWPSYEAQTTVIFDDFAPNNYAGTGEFMKIDDLLRALDVYEVQVQYKGGYSQLVAKKFVICSNFMPEEWYPGHSQLEALKRRITAIYMFPQVWQPTPTFPPLPKRIQIYSANQAQHPVEGASGQQ